MSHRPYVSAKGVIHVNIIMIMDLLQEDLMIIMVNANMMDMKQMH